MPAPNRLFLAAALLAALGCGGAQTPTDPDDRAVLRVTCPVADAVLWVDGRYVAQLRDIRGGVALPPGRHQIELRHDRHHAHYEQIELAVGQRFQLEIELAEAFP
jgi:hypothetical protein